MNNENNLYILEAYNPDMSYENGTVVALTPEVCYRLDKNNVEYLIIDDFYDNKLIFSDREKFLAEQNEWIKEIDSYLKQQIDCVRLYDLDLASIYLLRIKNLVDPIIYKSIIISSLFDKFNPSKVYFVTDDLGNNTILNDQLYYTNSIYSYLLPITCKKYSVPFVKKSGNITCKQIITSKSSKIQEYKKSAKFLIKVISKSLIHQKNKPTLNILQLSSAYNGQKTILDGISRGHNVHLLMDNCLYRHKGRMFGRQTIRIEDSNLQHEEWINASESIQFDLLLEWVNNKSNIEVKSVVYPLFKHFIVNICPKIVKYFIYFQDYYHIQKIDVVISPYMQNVVELAALEAAKKNEYIETFCVEHGNDIFDDLFWRLNELRNHDHVIALDNNNKKFLSNVNEKYHTNSKIHVSSDRMEMMIKINRQRKKHEPYSKKMKEILYVPTFYTYNIIRIDKNVHLSPTKYYKLQKKIFDYFASNTEHSFIWKGLFNSDQIYNPFPEMAKDMNLTNIRFETEPFVDYLPIANKIIFDHPSTGFYEATLAGIQCISLYSDQLSVRDGEQTFFDGQLKKYTNYETVISIVDQYVNEKDKGKKNTIETKNAKTIIEIIETSVNVS